METFNTIKSNWLKLENIWDWFIGTISNINENTTDPQWDLQTVVELVNVTKIFIEWWKKVTKWSEILIEWWEEKTEKLVDDTYNIGFKNTKKFVINKIKTLSPWDRCKIIYKWQFKSWKPQPAKTIDILKGQKDPNFVTKEEAVDIFDDKPF